MTPESGSMIKNECGSESVIRFACTGFTERVKGRVAELEMDPKLKEAGWEKYAEFKIWFDKRLDAAIKKVIDGCLKKKISPGCPHFVYKRNLFLVNRQMYSINRQMYSIMAIEMPP